MSPLPWALMASPSLVSLPSTPLKAAVTSREDDLVLCLHDPHSVQESLCPGAPGPGFSSAANVLELDVHLLMTRTVRSWGTGPLAWTSHCPVPRKTRVPQTDRSPRNLQGQEGSSEGV